MCNSIISTFQCAIRIVYLLCIPILLMWYYHWAYGICIILLWKSIETKIKTIDEKKNENAEREECV